MDAVSIQGTPEVVRPHVHAKWDHFDRRPDREDDGPLTSTGAPVYS